MEATRVGTLHLSGQNAVSFFHSFFHPTEEECRQFNEIRDSIDHEVSIRVTEFGFEAEIEGLDLSFLDK